jgi:hypothetical protein
MAQAPAPRGPRNNGWAELVHEFWEWAKTPMGARILAGIAVVIVVHQLWTLIVTAIYQVATIGILVWIIGFMVRGGTKNKGH